MVFVRASGDDMDEAIEMFTRTYELSPPRVTPSAGPFSWSHHATGDETMTIRSNRFVGTMETTLGSDDELIVRWARSGQTTLESASSRIELTPGTPFVMPNRRLAMRVRAIDPVGVLVHIDSGFVRSVADELDDVHFLAFQVDSPVSDRASRIWRRTVDLVAAVVLDTSLPSSSLLRREMSRLLVVATLTAFPFDSTPRAPGAAGVEPASIREAYEFVHQNAHLPISAPEIARAVGLSVRSLQSALRRYRETTPTRLLQSARLGRVHTELLAAEPRSGSVSSTAREWGFVHLGRFAGAYFERYGETPRDTLRR